MMLNNSVKEIFSAIKEEILKANRIVLSSHINPDGDNLGSVLGMYSVLKQMGKEVYPIIDDEIPKDYKFLPSSEVIKRPEEINFTPDLFITLDSATLDRIGKSKEIFEKAKKTINFDHHKTNDSYADLNYVSEKSATGEVLFEFFHTEKIGINKAAATCLYTAISSDTGSFKYDSTSSYTFYAASELMKKGIDINEIAVNLYQNRSKSKTKLLIEVASKIKYYFDDKVGLGKVTNDIMESVGAEKHDSEGIVEFIRDIEGLELAVLLKEKKDGGVRLSMRSKSQLDCAKIASFFGGGGHTRAAGATIDLPIDKAEEVLIEEIKKQL
ncbi:bifunctional oligoribonuclease/PAP phosphatase NrnA [Peptoniphilus sp. GNH]|nr:bifunctional oligoribonuclease/PAP phosphatase NrnA [Peptoniphilus sp. GNH]